MSDVYVPGVKSRFNTEKIIEDLMKVERIPRDRVEQTIERLQNEKSNWQELGRRIGTLRDSARLLYSFQNPFNDRTISSSDSSAITGTATREAVEQERSFTVKQVAQADRFLSTPQENSFRVGEGTYTFSIGDEKISFSFQGGTLREFTEALNRRGRDKIQSSLVNVKQGYQSLIIESQITGEGKSLGFSDAAEGLVVQLGMIERISDSRRTFPLNAGTVQEQSPAPGQSALSFEGNALSVAAEGSARIALEPGLQSNPKFILRLETATKVFPDTYVPPESPPGPTIPPPGRASYGGIAIENDPTIADVPSWQEPEPPVRVDNLGVLSVTFSDGTSAKLPPLTDSDDFTTNEYRLGDIAGNKTIVALNLANDNSLRDISIRNIEAFDPDALGGFKPLNPISKAQDAVVFMDGIEITRPTNTIDDLIPGVTLIARTPSDYPAQIKVEADREGVKNAIIDLVGNYNRLMAELNVLTRNDERVIQELSYLSAEERADLRKRMGAFSADSSLNQMRSNLQQAVTAPYPTPGEQDIALLAQIGIGTDVRRAGGTTGYDPSRLRGYLEIDERALDAALETKLSAIKLLFGRDTTGDLLVDTGIAPALETLAKPYVDTGGIIALKSGTVDSQISQEQRRIETLDRQLAAKEATLKNQYGQMEGAYNRMDRMSTSIDQFSRQQNGNGR